MWPIKDFLTYRALFTKDGFADFSLKTRDKVPRIFGVVFALDIYARMHSLCNNETLSDFNELLETVIDYSIKLGFEEGSQKLDELCEKSFRLSSNRMVNNQEIYLYKSSGVFLRHTSLFSKIPNRGLEINRNLAFTRLLVILSKTLSTEQIELLLTCFKELSVCNDFTLRKYNFINYTRIPKRIFYQYCSNGSSVWG